MKVQDFTKPTWRTGSSRKYRWTPEALESEEGMLELKERTRQGDPVAATIRMSQIREIGTIAQERERLAEGKKQEAAEKKAKTVINKMEKDLAGLKEQAKLKGV